MFFVNRIFVFIVNWAIGNHIVAKHMVPLFFLVSAAACHRGRYCNPTVRPAWYRNRQRAITPAQRRAEALLWPTLGLSWRHGEPLDIERAFDRPAPTVLEIGCGTGEALAAMASARPSHNFIGVDWYRGGVASALQRLASANLSNVRLIRGDASTLLSTVLPETPLFDEVRKTTAINSMPLSARISSSKYSVWESLDFSSLGNGEFARPERYLNSASLT